MIWLVLGLFLFAGSHFFKRLAPQMRSQMGDRGKGLVAVLSLAGIVLMVIGYRSADVTDLYYPPAFLTHLNNLLMVLAVYLYVSSGSGNWIARKVRNPQLTAAKVWALAHLLVNGDLASLVLFGGLMAWAVISVILIKRSKQVWAPSMGWPVKGEVQALIGTIVVLAVIAWVHTWLGYWPFGG
jgi:uncharacterized membrane protein